MSPGPRASGGDAPPAAGADRPAAPRVALLSVGDELLGGDIADGNAHWIANALAGRGHRLVAMATVGDRVDEIATAVTRLRQDAGWLLVTGGLGPTADDLTRDGIARACGRSLSERPEIIAALEARRLRVTAGARRQAELPEGALVLPNERGTAPGFLVEHEGFHVAAFPGVPGEMRPMVTALLDGRLPRGPEQPPRRVHATGLPESHAGERLGALLDPTGATCRMGITVRAGVLTVTVRGTDARAMDSAADAAAARLGPHVFARGATASLTTLVVEELRRRGLRVSCAESCTGGLLAATLTSVPGASEVFAESVVVYSNDAKTARLGVSPALLASHGAVSEPVAAAMAEGCRRLTGADVALAISGIAGPGGGSADKPVGTLVLALADAAGTVAATLRATGSRDEVRSRAVQGALDLLRRRLDPGSSSGPA